MTIVVEAPAIIKSTIFGKNLAMMKDNRSNVIVIIRVENSGRNMKNWNRSRKIEKNNNFL